MKSSLFAAAALFLATPAAAQTFPHWESGPWQVDSDGKDCLLVYSVETGQVAIAVAKTDTDFYMQVIAAGTSTADADKSYPVVVMLGQQRYTSVGRKLPQGGAIGTLLNGRSADLMKVVGRADRISFTVTGIGGIDAPLTPEARAQFLKCEASIGGAGSAPEPDQ